MTTRTPDCQCPWCHHHIDSATVANAGESVPKPQDLSVCLYCLLISIFDDTLRLRKPTPAEWHEIDASGKREEIERIRRAMRLSFPRGN